MREHRGSIVVAVEGRPTDGSLRTKQRAPAADNAGDGRGLWRKA